MIRIINTKASIRKNPLEAFLKHFLNNPIHYNKFQEEVGVIVFNKMIGKIKLTVKGKMPQCGRMVGEQIVYIYIATIETCNSLKQN